MNLDLPKHAKFTFIHSQAEKEQPPTTQDILDQVRGIKELFQQKSDDLNHRLYKYWT